MRPDFARLRWETLQAKAHLPEAQTIIRHEIARGKIRVVPAPDGGIRIIPVSGAGSVEEPEPSAAVGIEMDHRRVPVLASKG